MHFTLGDKVFLVNQVTYLKTAEPMPTLRPTDLVIAGEIGEILAMQACGTLAVEFNCGIVLVEATMLQSVY
ncbi:hypothetical protein PMYN1_Chma211 (chromatophore) [Paulinella micropora]|nr:hypothetical protein PMYN1_Chma211 [Paulinella micropora]